MNKVFLEGRLGDAPRIMRGAKGAIARLRVATNETIRRADGTAEKFTEWHTVIAFNALAEACEGLQRGEFVSLNGRLATRSFQTKDGHKSSETQVITACISRPLQRVESAQPAAPAEAPHAAVAASPPPAKPAEVPPQPPVPATPSAPVRFADGSPEGVRAAADAACAATTQLASTPTESAPQPTPAPVAARRQAPVEEIPGPDDPFADMDQFLREQLESL